VELRGDSPEHPACGIRLEGLTLACSDFGERFNEIDGTHGTTCWNEPANLEAVVYVENAIRCAIRACEIRGAGYSGVALVHHAQAIELWGNLIHDCGYHGIILQGYAPRTGEAPPDVNREHRIVNNHIHHCGQLVGHGAGIFMHSSGHNLLAHNLIHHMPRYGICAKGQYDCPPGQVWEQWNERANHSRANTIEFNHIHDVNLDSEDSGFISFMSCGRHNIVRSNLLHGCDRELGGGSQGIYLDDGVGYTTVEKNLIYDLEGRPGHGPGTACPIFAKGIFNTIQDNILIGGPKCSALIWNISMVGRSCAHHTYRRNILWIDPAEGQENAVMILCGDWSPNRLDACENNLYWAGGRKAQPVFRIASTTLKLRDWQAYEDRALDRSSLLADPLFVDPAHHDYRLHPESPALKLGIKSFDPSQCGLTPDFPFPANDNPLASCSRAARSAHESRS
jgi:hypothetical protein